MKRNIIILFALTCMFAAACGINSVTKEELGNVKAGNLLVYRYQKEGKSWFFAQKITRVEGDKIYFNESKSESTSGSDARIREYVTDEDSMPKAELLKFSEEQGAEQKKIIWIE